MKKVLLVFYPNAKSELKLLAQAKQLQAQQDVQLDILYVIPRLPGYLYQIPEVEMVAEALRDEAETALKQIARMLQVPSDHQWLAVGNVIGEAEFLAKHLHIDEIIGSPHLWELCRIGLKKIGLILASPVGLPKYRKDPLRLTR